MSPRVKATKRPRRLKPKSLDEALTMLETIFPKEELERIRAGAEADMGRYHRNLGMWMRNTWGLWSGSPLKSSFQAMGVFHPDDMSSIIFRAFWRRQKDLPLEIDAMAAYSRRYWEVRSPPAEAKPCATGKPASRLFGLCADKAGAPRYLHVYACRGALWIYELDAGWSKPDEKLRARIAKLRKTRGLVEAPLQDRARSSRGRRAGPP
jgi:hypothetical protein